MLVLRVYERSIKAMTRSGEVSYSRSWWAGKVSSLFGKGNVDVIVGAVVSW